MLVLPAFAFALLIPPQVQEPAKPAPVPAVAIAPAAPAALHVLRSFPIGGDGGWDYVTIDSEHRRLYVPHATHVVVLDADTGKPLGDLPDTAGVHGVALAPDLGKGFASNGRADTVTVFDPASLAVLKTIPTGKNPDALAYEPTTKCVYIGDGRSNYVTVLSAEKLAVVATIPVGGKPEAVVVDGKGKVWVNVEDKSEVVGIDAKTNTVEHHFPLAPGEEPSGLAIDVEHGRLFAVCSNETMVVVDAATGKVLASPKIGAGVDAAAFDPATGRVFASNGAGTVSVVATTGAAPFTVVQTVPTAPGARTLCFDPKTGCLYLPCAEYEAAGAAAGGKKRPPMKKDSFRVLVVGVGP